jgi:hypothetical protein
MNKTLSYSRRAGSLSTSGGGGMSLRERLWALELERRQVAVLRLALLMDSCCVAALFLAAGDIGTAPESRGSGR